MKTNQAKAVAGIKYNLTTRQDYVRAERDCKNLIVSARKAGDDNRAAELSGAKSVFQKRARANTTGNACAICGITIARGATHCRIHHRTQNKAPAAPDGFKTAESKTRKGNGNARVDVSPSGGLIARFGFYLTPVQTTFKKWRAALGEATARECFIQAASGLPSHRQISLSRLPRAQWQCSLELGAALASVVCDRTKVESWLLQMPIQVATGKGDSIYFDSIKSITEKIAARGGRNKNGEPFSAAVVSKALSRLRLTTPAEKAKSFRRVVKTK